MKPTDKNRRLTSSVIYYATPGCIGNAAVVLNVIRVDTHKLNTCTLTHSHRA